MSASKAELMQVDATGGWWYKERKTKNLYRFPKSTQLDDVTKWLKGETPRRLPVLMK